MITNCTLVCADTGPSALKSYKALCHSTNAVDTKGLFFTDTPNKEEFSNSRIQNVRIQNLNQKYAYDFFILSQLPNYIDTTHYLIIQSDGFIMNPLAWNDLWLQYDYIGAPWALHPYHCWPPHANVTLDNNVGNGGFSLRSLKLAKQVQKIFCSLSKSSTFYPEMWYPEDCFICRDLRPLLEKEYQIKFAPVFEAQKFSCENRPYNGQFGFHGKETMSINGIKYCA